MLSEPAAFIVMKWITCVRCVSGGVRNTVSCVYLPSAPRQVNRPTALCREARDSNPWGQGAPVIPAAVLPGLRRGRSLGSVCPKLGWPWRWPGAKESCSCSRSDQKCKMHTDTPSSRIDHTSSSPSSLIRGIIPVWMFPDDLLWLSHSNPNRTHGNNWADMSDSLLIQQVSGLLHFSK